MIAAVAASAVLAASPARLAIAGAASRRIVVTSRGVRAAVTARPAGLALALRGRPRIVAAGRGSAAAWLTVRPRRLVLRPGAAAALTVTAAPPPHASPGEHDALVVLTALLPRRRRVALRLRVGVRVVVSVRGLVLHRLGLGRLAVRRHGGAARLELRVVNRGNVGESLGRGRLRVALLRGGRVVARLHPVARELLPRTSGLVELPYRGRLRGRLTAVVELVRPQRGVAVVRRRYTLRL